MGHRRGFTLVELLVVMVIILAISVVALPSVIHAIGDRQMGEAARLVQASLAGARDAAIHANAPRGIRLLPDPAFAIARLSNGQLDPAVPLAANRIIPIESAPDYSEGRLDYYNPFPGAANPWPHFWNPSIGTPPRYPGAQGTAPYNWYPAAFPGFIQNWVDNLGQPHNPNVLCVVESLRDPNSLVPHSPTSWFWNIRLGDKIRVADSTVYFTVVGPMTVTPAQGNSELFVNDGPSGSVSQLRRTYSDGSLLPVEYLFLINGKDDDGNGFIDDGWDGVDNNRDPNLVTDDLDEWEHETWMPPPVNLRSSLTYTIRRRPVPSLNTKEVALPSSVVIDLTTWSTTAERSRLPVNLYTGYVDVLLNPDGTAVPTTIYSSPSTIGLTGSFLHFWLADRGDVMAPVTGLGISTLPMPIGTAGYTATAVVKSGQALITLNAKTGRVTTTENPKFDGVLDSTNLRYGIETPFLAAKQGQ
jgi:prepilin-type N-terminal cleavage/methylation domain-containing protein